MAKRIEEPQIRNERKAEMAALSRDELITILSEIVHAARSRLPEARTADGLKAAELLRIVESNNLVNSTCTRTLSCALIARSSSSFVLAAQR